MTAREWATNTEQAAYWDRQPCNVRNPVLWKYQVEPHIPEFAEFTKWRGQRVLEVGCGIGTDTLSFIVLGAEVTAVDISEESISRARLRTHSHARFIHADFEDGLPIKTEPFDLIYAFGVLHHTANPGRMLRQMSRYSHPQTRLKLMVYNRWSYKALRIWLFGERTEAQAGCPIVRTYSRRQIRKLVKQYNFRVTSIKTRHLFPYRIEDYRNGRLRKTWLFAHMPGWTYKMLERLVGWHLLVDAEVV